MGEHIAAQWAAIESGNLWDDIMLMTSYSCYHLRQAVMISRPPHGHNSQPDWPNRLPQEPYQ